MQNYSKTHHQLIRTALENFNHDFLAQHRILFGGGTRIALELSEYRESIDIDFLCPDKQSYRAVRHEVTEYSLGNLVKNDFSYPREIRADRDAVRCFIEINGTRIKLEFVSFADYQLTADPNTHFPVPALSKSSCYVTKLLANADRYADSPYKDIFDILAMFLSWGEIPQDAWEEADAHYGKSVVIKSLIKSCSKIAENKLKYQKIAIEELDICPDFTESLLNITFPKFVDYINRLEASI